MQADPLQQLRALHTPEPPGLWPPAPGWWLLAALLGLLLAWLVRLGMDLRRTLAPHRQAAAEHSRLQARLAAGELDSATYLNEANALLKRLLLFALDNRAVAASSGKEWLLELDDLTDSTGFSHGPGTLLADARFEATVPVVPPALPELVERALKAARGRALRRWAERRLPFRRRREADA